MLHEITGLPAHPLIVHMPLVLAPIVGVLTLALLRPSWRDRLLWPLAGLAVVTAFFAIIAAVSGEWFAEQLRIGEAIHAHEEAAELFRNVEILLAVALVAAAVGLRRLPRAAQTAAVVVIAALGIGSVAAVVDAGHKGAEQVWGGALQNGDDSGGD
ncbi:MAG: hypothetical protein PGN13_03990 [Patulibacter minatonensis]